MNMSQTRVMQSHDKSCAIILSEKIAARIITSFPAVAAASAVRRGLICQLREFAFV